MADSKPRVVKGTPSVQLSHDEFVVRFRRRHEDPAFRTVAGQLDAVAEVAWNGYTEYRKAPHTRKAGAGYADPDYDLSVDWSGTRKEIQAATARQHDSASPSRILLINGSARSDQTCPGEMSKTYRLAQVAREVIEAEKRFEVDFLDLSHLTSEYGRVIYPCKACVSTA